MAEEIIRNFNFALPPTLAQEFRAIGDTHGERNKLRWAVAGAAVLRLLEMPPDEMEKLIQAVAGAKYYPATLREMIAAAKAKAVPLDQKAGVKKPPRAKEPAKNAAGKTAVQSK